MDELIEKLLPSSQVVNAISRIPDQHLQNLVMRYFSRYENTAWTALFEARDRMDELVDAIERIYEISTQGLADGNHEDALLEVCKLSKEFQSDSQEELMVKDFATFDKSPKRREDSPFCAFHRPRAALIIKP